MTQKNKELIIMIIGLIFISAAIVSSCKQNDNKISEEQNVPKAKVGSGVR